MRPLQDLLARNRNGRPVGVWSACTAHPLALRACMDDAVRRGAPLLVEATCNQVNQEGGYTGMTPAAFKDAVAKLAAEAGLPKERLWLGGDHLGPNPWKRLPAAEAMARARAMVRAYVEAGFGKLHLDASMACADDPSPLPDDVIAARAADLAAVAEAVAQDCVYVVGTEVPTPGGATEALDHVVPTAPEAVRRTVELHRHAFAKLGLERAFERVVAVVVQPGVEFGTDDVLDFDPAAAAPLTTALRDLPGLVFEAHSTDYQTEAGLTALVRGGFAILKVGPWLTFALREALFGLAMAQVEMGRGMGLRAVLDRAMRADPEHWQGHYHGDSAEIARARAFSLADRCRYYWTVPEVDAAVRDLLARPLPPFSVLSQFLPGEALAVRERAIPATGEAVVRHRVGGVAGIYARACGQA